MRKLMVGALMLGGSLVSVLLLAALIQQVEFKPQATFDADLWPKATSQSYGNKQEPLRQDSTAPNR